MNAQWPQNLGYTLKAVRSCHDYHWFYQIYGANYILNEVKFLTKVIKSNFVSYPQVDKLVGLLTLIF